MYCPNCNQATSEGAVFCNRCGTRLDPSCPVCNRRNPNGSRFCHACGTALLGDSGSPATSPIVDQPPSFNACPRCNTTNEPRAVYCYACGLPLGQDLQSSTQTTMAGTPAGFWIRLAAWLIDMIILMAAGLAIAAAWPGTSVAEYFNEYGPVNLVVWMVQVLYYVAGVSVWSTTVGKRIFGIYVLRPDGSKLGPGRALARWLAYFLSSVILFIGFIMIGFRSDKRGLHDLICDTVVVKRDDLDSRYYY